MTPSSSDLRDTEHQARQLIDIARHAPSSHNTQPWIVTVEKDHTIDIGYSPERQLFVGDPEKRDLYMSLGCFIESLLLVAEDFGISTEYRYVGTEPHCVASITLRPDSKPTGDVWSGLIQSRRSDRRFYDATPIDDSTVQTLSRLSVDATEVHIIKDPVSIALLGNLTYDATVKFMQRDDFRAELAAWVRNNWTRKHDGMPAFVQGIPGPISLIAPTIIRKLKKTAQDQAKKDAARMVHSAAACIISTNDETPAGWIMAGRVYQRVCLEATRRGLATAAVSAAVSMNESISRIQEVLNIKGKPVVLLRIGSAVGPKLRKTPRRTTDEILR